jgi:hypothetical protein
MVTQFRSNDGVVVVWQWLRGGLTMAYWWFNGGRGDLAIVSGGPIVGW